MRDALRYHTGGKERYALDFAAELDESEGLTNPTVQAFRTEYVFGGAGMVPQQPQDVTAELVVENPAPEVSGTQVIFWLEWTGAVEQPSTRLRHYEVLVRVETNSNRRIAGRAPLIVESSAAV